MMVEMYYDQDANLEVLEGKTIAVVGYGSQGHAQAQNLRDSGLNVIVAQRKGGENYQRAIEDGFEVYTAAEAAAKADLIQILLPDEIQSFVYKNDIEPNLEEGN